MKMSMPDRTFVNYLGKGNTLGVIHGEDRLTVRTNWFTKIIVFLWSVALAGASWLLTFHEQSPLFWLLLVWLLTLLCWLAFVRNLFGTPRAEILYATGEIQLFRWRSAQPKRTICRDEVAGWTIEKQSYVLSEGNSSVENSVLILRMRSAERLPLCASDDGDLIRNLAEELSRLTGAELKS
jgi:hypothetical protein